jgi:cytochrome c
MFKRVAAMAVATLTALPAFAQSHDPSLGSGNTALSAAQAEPESPAARRGWIFVRVHCAQCHAINRGSASALATARPLYALQIRYPVADLQRPLAEGIHPTMPAFRLSSGQLADIMAYLKTLRP